MHEAALSAQRERRCGDDAVVRSWGRVREDRLGRGTIGRMVLVEAVKGEVIT